METTTIVAMVEGGSNPSRKGRKIIEKIRRKPVNKKKEIEIDKNLKKFSLNLYAL